MRERRGFLAIIGYRATNTRAHIRWVLRAGSLALAINAPFDLDWPHPLALLAVRAAWILVFVTTAALQRHPRGRVAAGAFVFACVASALAMSAEVGLSGGIGGPRGGLLLTLPLVMLMLVPTRPLGALAGCATVTLCGVYLWTREAARPAIVVEWTVVSLTLGLLLTFGAMTFRRLWMERLAAERDRVEALERLQASERVRAETEHDLRLALIAAEMAHEINNPLLIATANLDFAAHELAEAGATEELVPALHDAHEGLSRIREVVADLHMAASAPATEARATTLEAIVDEGVARARARQPSLRCRLASLEARPLVGDASVLASAVMHVVLAAASDGRALLVTATREGERATLRVGTEEPTATVDPRAHARALPLLLARVMLRRLDGSVVEASDGTLVASLRARDEPMPA